MDGWFVLTLLLLASFFAFGGGWNLHIWWQDRQARRQEMNERLDENCWRPDLPSPFQIALEQKRAWERLREVDQEWRA